MEAPPIRRWQFLPYVLEDKHNLSVARTDGKTYTWSPSKETPKTLAK